MFSILNVSIMMESKGTDGDFESYSARVHGREFKGFRQLPAEKNE